MYAVTNSDSNCGDGSSAIHDALREQNWLQVMELCQTRPMRARHINAWTNETSLHLACLHKCPDPSIFEALVRAFPEALLKQENKGMVPLHYACRYQASFQVSDVLVNFVPEKGHTSVTIRDCKGRTPLYYAKRYDAPEQLVEMLQAIESREQLEDEGLEDEEHLQPQPPARRIDEGLDDEELLHSRPPAQRIDEGLDDEPPRPCRQGDKRYSSFYQSLYESSSDEPMAAAMGYSSKDIWTWWKQEEDDWKKAIAASSAEAGDGEAVKVGATSGDAPGDREILEQFRIMAEHEARRRLKESTGFDVEEDQQKMNVRGDAVSEANNMKNHLKMDWPKPRPIVNPTSMPQLQEPSLPSFRLDPVFRGRKAIMEPEVTPGELVASQHQDHDSAADGTRIIECLGCRRMLRAQQKAMIVSCPNCNVNSPAISARHVASL